MENPLNYEELNRAESLANKLHSAILRARHFRQAKVSLPIEEAEELAQLLFDSLRSIRDINYDTPSPMEKIPSTQRRIHMSSRCNG